MVGLNLVDRVAPAEPYRWDGERAVPLAPPDARPGKGGLRLAVYDLGVKWNMLRLLAARGFDMIVVPPSCTPKRLEEFGAQAVLLSNGPGDPEALADLVECARLLAGRYPTAGICLGHQILGKALGGVIRKMKFGHHGCNHPVKDLRTGRVEISSQNHGFCVDIAGAPNLEACRVNLNDGTLEGFTHKTRPVMTLQYHPEACPGPGEAGRFFAEFHRMALEAAG
jgi:carbamoyl-phosphate synthase small subunit